MDPKPLEDSGGAAFEGPPPGGEAAPPRSLRDRIEAELKTVYDPEIPVDIWELGLVYELEVDDEGNARIVMTLTSPNCPVAESLPIEVERKVRAIEGVRELDLQLTWDPPWTMDKMSEAARLTLGMG